MLGMQAGDSDKRAADNADPVVMPASGSTATAAPGAVDMPPADAAVAAEPVAPTDAGTEVVPGVTPQPPVDTPKIKRPAKPKRPRDVGESRI